MTAVLQLWDYYNRPVGSSQKSRHGLATGHKSLGRIEKLSALKDQGVLTGEEFQKAENKLLSEKESRTAGFSVPPGATLS